MDDKIGKMKADKEEDGVEVEEKEAGEEPQFMEAAFII